jgi:hypothetical protein
MEEAGDGKPTPTAAPLAQGPRSAAPCCLTCEAVMVDNSCSYCKGTTAVKKKKVFIACRGKEKFGCPTTVIPELWNESYGWCVVCSKEVLPQGMPVEPEQDKATATTNA